MFPQELLDAALIQSLERLDVSGPYKVLELSRSFSDKIVWHLKPQASPGAVIRVENISERIRMESSFEFLRQCHAAGIPVNEPYFCEPFKEQLVVSACRYIDGETGTVALPRMDPQCLNENGRKAGEILRKIHETSVTKQIGTACAKRRILDYEKNQEEAYQQQLNFADQTRVEDFIEEHISKLSMARVCNLHNNFGPKNWIFHKQHLAGLIGFEATSVGDPLEDFLRIPWDTLSFNERIARAQIEGYLDKHPIENFWTCYNLAVGMSITAKLVTAYKLKDDKALQNAQYKSFEIVNTHDFIDGGPPVWY